MKQSNCSGGPVRAGFLLIGTLLLTGCAAPHEPSVAATSDSVLQAQYRAGAPHGVIGGDEAGKIYDNYLAKIGAEPTPLADGTQTSGAANGH